MPLLLHDWTFWKDTLVMSQAWSKALKWASLLTAPGALGLTAAATGAMPSFNVICCAVVVTMMAEAKAGAVNSATLLAATERIAACGMERARAPKPISTALNAKMTSSSPAA